MPWGTGRVNLRGNQVFSPAFPSTHAAPVLANPDVVACVYELAGAVFQIRDLDEGTPDQAAAAAAAIGAVGSGSAAGQAGGGAAGGGGNGGGASAASTNAAAQAAARSGVKPHQGHLVAMIKVLYCMREGLPIYARAQRIKSRHYNHHYSSLATCCTPVF